MEKLGTAKVSIFVHICARNEKTRTTESGEEEKSNRQGRGAENRNSLISMQVMAGWKRASNYKNGSQLIYQNKSDIKTIRDYIVST